MKPMMLVGIVLIILGIAALAYQGITYTTREKVLEISSLEATKKTQKTIPGEPFGPEASPGLEISF